MQHTGCLAERDRLSANALRLAGSAALICMASPARVVIASGFHLSGGVQQCRAISFNLVDEFAGTVRVKARFFGEEQGSKGLFFRWNSSNRSTAIVSLLGQPLCTLPQCALWLGSCRHWVDGHAHVGLPKAKKAQYHQYDDHRSNKPNDIVHCLSPGASESLRLAHPPVRAASSSSFTSFSLISSGSACSNPTTSFLVSSSATMISSSLA